MYVAAMTGLASTLDLAAPHLARNDLASLKWYLAYAKVVQDASGEAAVLGATNSRSTLYSVLGTLYSVLCALCSVLCMVYSVLCTVYFVLCTVYSVLCTLYSIL